MGATRSLNYLIFEGYPEPPTEIFSYDLSVSERGPILVSAANLQSQAYQFQQDTLSGRWKWTTYMDVSGATPLFRVSNIVSPFGILRDSIPIPGEIVEAMAASITEIRTQFPPAIFVGPPSSLVFEVDEGRGYSLPLPVILTNTGTFGSLLGATLTSDAAYMSVTPAQIGNLASQESGTFEVAVDSSQLLAANSPYYQTIAFEDPNATNSPQAMTVTIVVRPKSEISVAPVSLVYNAIRPLAGDFAPVPVQNFTIQNTGPVDSVLAWQVQRVGCSPWLASFGPVSGSLVSGDTETITVLVQPPANTPVGVYTETLRVSGFSENQFVDVSIKLIVT